MELTANEKRLLAEAARVSQGVVVPTDTVAARLGATGQATLQWAHLLADKGLLEIEKTEGVRYTLTDEGRQYGEAGLPERQLLSVIGGGLALEDLKSHPLSRVGIGWLRKKGWMTIREGVAYPAPAVPVGEDERVLHALLSGDRAARSLSPATLRDLVRRGLVVEEREVSTALRLTPEGASLAAAGLDLREETGVLSREQILSGSWKDLRLRRYAVDTLPRRAWPGKIHPYQRLIDEMRETLLSMGFTELYGGLVQQCYWNFDALFQPQDHPAREMQDTFYLGERIPLPADYGRVKAMHESGGETSSTGWGGTWQEEKAEQCVLRTHTTCLSIQHLATHPEPPVKAFCIGRVYRRETTDQTHLAEFEQLEGIVMDEDVHFRHLLGMLREFYERMGFSGVRFKPSYYPYTEPSLDAEVYVEGIGWIEMGGAGIFREEVTAPFGIHCPVLAWGLGVSRIAMLRLGLRDVRYLHQTDIAFIRDTPVLFRPAAGGGA